MSVQSISLAYKDGGSDKVYFTQIEEKDGGYVVNFSYGRRGSTLASGTKTASPVPMPAAQKVYDKLVAEKKAKGYSEGAEGTPFAGNERAGETSGLIPQLLNAIEESHAMSLLEDDDWFMQEKKDGVRQFVTRVGNTVTGGNRKGLVVGVSQAIADAVLALTTRETADFILDGEAMGDVYWPFDIRSYGGQSSMDLKSENRLVMLNGLLDTASSPALGRVPTAFTTRQKQALFEKIKTERGEGVVFKKLGSKYVPGRPASGGNQVKFKFKESATVIVLSQNMGKRSVQVAVTMNDWIPVGSVTIPSNYAIPTSNSIVEVEYLYAFPGGSLYQPVYKGPRSDKDVADVYSSLKFKQGTTEDDDA